MGLFSKKSDDVDKCRHEYGTFGKTYGFDRDQAKKDKKYTKSTIDWAEKDYWFLRNLD